ncbi:MAG: hypothetical protein DWI58_04590 [Chloroflexi bacterium]|nr:MAG: hypothetical protein DWI58_04590 [Chloroflexota bacterium]
MTASARIREDVHVHASAHAIRLRILDLTTYDEWLAPAFRDFRADDEAYSFALALPGHTEQARLRRGGVEERAVTFVRDGGGDYESITWVLHAESPREVHLTVEATYTPAGGLSGAILEPTVHRPHRTQALRDSLWRLKQLAERTSDAS